MEVVIMATMTSSTPLSAQVIQQQPMRGLAESSG